MENHGFYSDDGIDGWTWTEFGPHLKSALERSLAYQA
jgi:hypothetical protein